MMLIFFSFLFLFTITFFFVRAGYGQYIPAGSEASAVYRPVKYLPTLHSLKKI